MAKSGIEKLRIPISRIYAVLIVLLYAFSKSRDPEMVGSSFFSVGLFLIAIATVGRLWCSLYVSGYKTRHLIMDGPYSVCRNPLYFFSLIGIIGIGLSSEMFSILALLLIPYAFYYPLVIRGEENKLLERHGDSYAEYLQTTPRFFPKWSLFREPETYLVNPWAFRKELLSAVWFVWVAAGMKLVEELHDLNALPALFHLR